MGTRLSDVPSNAPISYTVNGKQYIAIGVGNGGAQAMTFPPLVPEIQNVDRAPGDLGLRTALIRRAVKDGGEVRRQARTSPPL